MKVMLKLETNMTKSKQYLKERKEQKFEEKYGMLLSVLICPLAVVLLAWIWVSVNHL